MSPVSALRGSSSQLAGSNPQKASYVEKEVLNVESWVHATMH